MKSAVLLSFLFSLNVRAQTVTEAPPNEPPYTTVEDEFDAAVIEAPAPAAAPIRAAPVVADPVPAATRPTRTEGHKQFVKHPGARQGLKLIDRDGSYIYAPTKTAKREQTSTFRFGQLTPSPGILSADGVTTYAQMYGSAQPSVISFEYEWKPWTSFGDIGLQLGIGFFTATGQGRFDCASTGCGDEAGEEEALEKYTFYAFPLTAGGIYRFQYMDSQWVSPYVAGGLTYYGLMELRDDNKAPNLVGSPHVYGAGGLLFNLSAMDEALGFSMDAEYGISSLWLTLEARQVQATNKDIDLGGTMLSLGVSADY